ncbi:Coenzyme Q-binding protein COQ10-like protein A, mitochondrial [Aphelenchoides besseyi]|nr:Coenzyme Q-binding protein COQ10-like protein A, mitochondrial [Aphelenchoides besseyi]
MTTTEEIDGVLGQIVSLCDVNDVIDLEVERIDLKKLYDLWRQLGLFLAALESTAFYASFRFSSTAECREIAIKNFEAVVILCGDSMIHFVPKILPKIEYYLHEADRFRCLSIVFDHFGSFCYKSLKHQVPICVEMYQKILDFLAILIRTCHSAILPNELLDVFYLIIENQTLRKNDAHHLRLINEFLAIDKPQITASLMGINSGVQTDEKMELSTEDDQLKSDLQIVAEKLMLENRYKPTDDRNYTAPQMFDVVHTVAEYPQFVPWCKQADVRKINEHVIEAELFIGYPPFHENYTSRVTSLYPNVVRSVVTEGRLFKFLETTWRFGPTDDGFPANSCNLDFTLEFEFKSALHAQFTQLFFGQVVRTMVTAFLNRAEQLYGPPSFDHFHHGVKSFTIKPER